VSTWLLYGNHRSLGASGMVMGALGLLAVQPVSFWRENLRVWKLALAGIAAGVMLFVLLGLSPGTDIVAHAGGFISGLVLGGLLQLGGRRVRDSAANVLAGVLFLLLTILPWWLALSRDKPG
jgi:membrane associated rhomboid family serine protease